MVKCQASNFFHHLEKELCEPCDKSCFKCSGRLIKDCLENSCTAGYQWNKSGQLCSLACSQGKYYEVASEKCALCPVLEECSICGPGKYDCASEESCHEGYEWDITKPNTCKLKLTMENLEDLGLNPNKKYFQAAPPEEPVIVNDENAEAGDTGKVREGETVSVAEEKTVIYQNDVAISVENDCTITYINPSNKMKIVLEQKAGDKVTLPANVETTMGVGCDVTFETAVATVERKPNEGLEKKEVKTEEPVTYEKDDIVEFLGESTEIQFIFDTKVEFRSKASLVKGNNISYRKDQLASFKVGASIRFLEPTKIGEFVHSNRIQYQVAAEVNVTKANLLKTVPKDSEQIYKAGTEVTFES